MARIKKEVITQEDNTLPITSETNTEITDNIQEEETTTEGEIIPEKENTIPQKETLPKEDIIPEYVNHILKMYPQYKELYIDNKRGTYTTPTKESTLYHNPHFNK